MFPATRSPASPCSSQSTRRCRFRDTFDHAEQRIPATLRHQERLAVTVDDYKQPALEMPAAACAVRGTLPPSRKPARSTPRRGLGDGQTAQRQCSTARLKADRTSFETLAAFTPKRLLRGQMYVIGTEYIGLGISVAVMRSNGFGLLQSHSVSRYCGLTLRLNFCGAQLTRVVWFSTCAASNSKQIVSQVPGVVEVNGLRLFQLQSGGTYQPLTINASGNSELILESWELP